MKWVKTIITIILLVLIAGVVWYSGMLEPVTSASNVYEKNGVTFEYPEDWSEANSVAEGSIAAVADTEDPLTSVVIQQVPSEYGDDLQTAYNTNNQYLTQYGNYIKIQELSSTLNNRSVIIHRYIINEDDGSQKEHVATWMKMSDGKLYVVLFSTPLESYESKRSNYDKVVDSFYLIKDDHSSNSFDLQSFLNIGG